jgi:MYXO-CTERM domain-containing protein
MKVLMYGFGVALAIVSIASNAYAGNGPAVPEIGADSIAAGLGLLSAGILVLRARRRK